MTSLFEYMEFGRFDLGQDEFALFIPSEIRSKADLLSALAQAGRFPGYFGGNWDALEDCLRDLGWIDARKVVIVHSDIPLQNDPAECRTYLEILNSVLTDWSAAARKDTCKPGSEWPPVEHELRVIFSAGDRVSVERLLGR